MLLINNEQAIEQSLQSVLNAVTESDSIDKNEAFGYAQAYISLRRSVLQHVRICTGQQNVPAADPNDIKDINI